MSLHSTWRDLFRPIPSYIEAWEAEPPTPPQLSKEQTDEVFKALFYTQEEMVKLGFIAPPAIPSPPIASSLLNQSVLSSGEIDIPALPLFDFDDDVISGSLASSPPLMPSSPLPDFSETLQSLPPLSIPPLPLYPPIQPSPCSFTGINPDIASLLSSFLRNNTGSSLAIDTHSASVEEDGKRDFHKESLLNTRAIEAPAAASAIPSTVFSSTINQLK